MFKRSWIVAAVVTGLAGAVAWACGPMFPNQLLDHRGDTLKAVPQNSFAFEATHLLVATDKLAVEEPSLYDDGGQHKDDAAQAKSLGISIAQLGRVDTLRALDDGDAAYAQGSDLPEDLRAYTAGAVDYAKGHQDKASLRFEQVLALPPAQATLRGVWAAYMLGRIHAANAASASNDATAFSRERAAAAKAFQLTRTRAVEGALDSQGLAVSSFGEEARLYLYGHGTQCSWNDLYGVADANNSEDGDATHTQGANAACGDGVPAADLKRAITLYAAQAGHGSNVGVQSLVAIADYAMRHPQRMAELIDNPVSQRLLVAYALARMGGSSEETPAGSAPKPDQPLLALVQAIEQRGMDKLEGADRLAALAYQTGRYELAAKLVDKSSGPLAEWVRAKLALQKGDLAAASASYAAAAKAFPKAGDAQAAIEPSNANLITGEQGVLALARGEYVEAMGHLYDAAVAVGGDGNVYDWDLETTSYGYGNDAMYIAERVLTVDELKSFVDARAPATPLTSKSPSSDDAYRYRSPIADSLRWVLARRLMRSGRYGDALPYFPADNDWRFGTYGDDGKLQVQSFRTPALSYAKALHDSEHAWTDIGKAQALYAAAVIAREHGMQILGYEQGPDYTDSEGSYQGGQWADTAIAAAGLCDRRRAAALRRQRSQAELSLSLSLHSRGPGQPCCRPAAAALAGIRSRALPGDRLDDGRSAGLRGSLPGIRRARAQRAVGAPAPRQGLLPALCEAGRLRGMGRRLRHGVRSARFRPRTCTQAQRAGGGDQARRASRLAIGTWRGAGADGWPGRLDRAASAAQNPGLRAGQGFCAIMAYSTPVSRREEDRFRF